MYSIITVYIHFNGSLTPLSSFYEETRDLITLEESKISKISELIQESGWTVLLMVLKGICEHFRKYAYSLFCWKLDEEIYVPLIPVPLKSVWASGWKAVCQCPLWFNVPNLSLTPPTSDAVWSEVSSVALETTPNSEVMACSSTLMQQGAKLNHERSAKTRFSGSFVLLCSKPTSISLA